MEIRVRSSAAIFEKESGQTTDKMKEDKKEEGKICIREINENIRRVYAGEELTKSLADLNMECRFRKKYNEFCRIQEGTPQDVLFLSLRYNEKFYSNPENKAYHLKYSREYRLRPEVKLKRDKYVKEYYQRPEVREHRRKWEKEYYHKPEVNAKAKAYRKEYYQRPEVLERHRRYSRNRKRINRWINAGLKGDPNFWETE